MPLSGLGVAFKQEKNLKIHMIFVILVSIAGVLLKISNTEWIICILLYGLVFVAELINTAIESTVDLCSPEIKPLAKQAKDIAASCVLISAITSIIIGIIIFMPKILVYFKS